VHLWTLAGFVAAYYVGKLTQFWNGRNERKTADAVKHIGKALGGDKDKGGTEK
jgi:hypothetical protein